MPGMKVSVLALTGSLMSLCSVALAATGTFTAFWLYTQKGDIRVGLWEACTLNYCMRSYYDEKIQIAQGFGIALMISTIATSLLCLVEGLVPSPNRKYSPVPYIVLAFMSVSAAIAEFSSFVTHLQTYYPVFSWSGFMVLGAGLLAMAVGVLGIIKIVLVKRSKEERQLGTVKCFVLVY